MKFFSNQLKTKESNVLHGMPIPMTVKFLSPLQKIFNRQTGLSFLFVVIYLIGFTIQASATKDQERMNVLFIVSDDLCVNGLGRAITPNIDRLFEMAVTFTHAYAQYPVCCPSRNSFLSGMKPDDLGGGAWAPLRDLAPNVTTLPQLFRENGYYTASIGKIFHVDLWDNRWPGESGWRFDDEKSWDFRVNCPPANQGKSRKPAFPRKGIRMTFPPFSGPIDYGMISFESDLDQEDGQATQEAIRQLDLPLDKPFFLAIGYRRPHAPFVAPEKYFFPYPLSSVQLPDPGDRSDVTRLAFNAFPPNFGVPDTMKMQKMCYLASVSFLDSQVGRLIQSLEEHGLMEKTIIILISDHGFQLGEHGNWNKNTLFEEDARVPFLIRIPGVTGEGVVSDAIVELVDLFPTLKEYCGLPDPNQKLAGRSLLPVLKNPSDPVNMKPAFTQVRRKIDNEQNAMGYSVRFRNYRYNEWWKLDGKQELVATELYDLEQDPVSEFNLSEQVDYQSVRTELSRLIEEYRSN
jgi:iduronate 2-sulfatase